MARVDTLQRVRHAWALNFLVFGRIIIKHYSMHICASLMIAASLANSGLTNAGATEGTDGPFDDITVSTVLNDGTVMGPGESFAFIFTDERPTMSHNQSELMSCPEVRKPPEYTITGVHRFIPDEDKPQSTWLEPDQEVTWAVSGNHTFQWDIGVGAEAEAGIVVAKAKTRIDTKISNSWTWSSTQTVKDHNGGRSAYRAVLGQVGYKLTAVKRWHVAPCTAKKKTIVVIVPRKGDMSIGRQKK